MRRFQMLATIFATSTLACLPLAAPAQDDGEQAEPEWRSLFDGKTLDGWKRTNFGGEGDVLVEGDALVMAMGSSLTGVTSTAEDLPTSNYEISLQAQQVDGIDFFCGLTFPVKDSHCSFIVGGWAGSVVGLSNIDNKDASENDTTVYRSFKQGQWYDIRVRVTDDRIQCWIDNERIVDQDITGREISTRPEVDLSKPLGIAAWETRAALKNIRIRKLNR